MCDLLGQIDYQLFVVINRTLVNPVCDVVMPIISELVWFVVPLIILLVYIIKRYRKRGYIVLVLTLLAITSSEVLTNRMLKPLFARTRPCNYHGQVHLYVHQQWMMTPEKPVRSYKPARSYSFPSAHAANTFTFATVWAIYLGGYSWLLFLVAGAVAFSRVYLGVHYPLDVAGGALLGIFLGIFWNTVIDELSQRWTWLRTAMSENE